MGAATYNSFNYVNYFLKGGESSQDEKAVAAINAVKLDNELGGRAVQVRVVQGREPRHFLKMFAGKMIVFTGGKVSTILTQFKRLYSDSLTQIVFLSTKCINKPW